MKKRILKKWQWAFVAIVMLAGTTFSVACSEKKNSVVTGELDYTKSDLQVKPFTAMEIDAVADVYYTQNNDDKQEVKLDFSRIDDAEFRSQLEKCTKIVYRDNKLIVGLDGKITGVSRLKEGKRLRIYVTSPDLVGVDLDGMGTFHADSINSDVFDIDNEGVGNFYIKHLLANKVKIDNEGVGNVTIGHLQADVLCIDNEGVGKIDAVVDCQSIKATLDGVGNICLSGVTRHFIKEKEGVGSFKVSDLRVLK